MGFLVQGSELVISSCIWSLCKSALSTNKYSEEESLCDCAVMCPFRQSVLQFFQKICQDLIRDPLLESLCNSSQKQPTLLQDCPVSTLQLPLLKPSAFTLNPKPSIKAPKRGQRVRFLVLHLFLTVNIVGNFFLKDSVSFFSVLFGFWRVLRGSRLREFCDLGSEDAFDSG